MCYQEGPKNHEVLKLNGTFQLVLYADDVNIPSEYINIHKTQTMYYRLVGKLV